MSEEKRPLLIKITKKKDPSPFSRVFIETMPPCSPPNAPPRTSSEKGEKNFGNPHSKKDEQVNVIEKLVFGEYSSLSEMVADVNGGQQSDMLEKILYRQMSKLLREDLHSLLKK